MEAKPDVEIVYGLSTQFPCEIYFYDLKTLTCKCKTLPLDKVIKGEKYEPRVPASCAMIGLLCVVCGGGHHDLPDWFKTTILCHITPTGDWTVAIHQGPDMPIAKAEHSLIAISDDIVLSVGGGCPKGVLSACEGYSVSKNAWLPYPPLTVAKKQTSLCVLSQSLVYAFGGKNAKDLPLSTIERLKLSDSKMSWRALMFLNERDFGPLAAPLVFPVSEDEIVIAGGTTYDLDATSAQATSGTLIELRDTKKAVVFNARTVQFVPLPDLPLASSFSVAPPMLHNGRAGAIDIQMSIFLFSLEKKQWSHVRENKWNSFKFHLQPASEMMALFLT